MNSLSIPMNNSGTNNVTITSLDLVKVINDNRKKSESELAHSDFLKKVPLVLGQEVAGNFSSNYKASNGKQNPCYNFPKREACLMAMSYSYDLQAKVFDYMTELENKLSQPKLPANYLEALKALTAEVEAKEKLALENNALTEKLDEAKPHVEFSKSVSNAINSITVAEFSKLIGVGEVTLFRWFKNHGYLMENRLPYEMYMRYFKVVEKCYKKNGEDVVYNQTLLTGDGQKYFTKKIKNLFDL